MCKIFIEPKNIVKILIFNELKFQNIFKKKMQIKIKANLIKLKILGHIFKFKFKNTKSLIKFNIGTSHKNFLSIKKNFKNLIVKKLKKNKIIIICIFSKKVYKGSSITNIKMELSKLQNKRKKNPYTKKGLHINSTIYKKKTGKKSTYV